MKKIINGKVYDTDTARRMAESRRHAGESCEVRETLYRKRTGEYFLHCEGGPSSQYGKHQGDNAWGWGEKIIFLKYEAARKWAEEHLDADTFAAIFSLPDEDAEDARLNICLPASIMAALKVQAAREAVSVTALVTRILGANVKA